MDGDNGEKLPHMPLWVYDIEADETCSLMGPAEFGIYMRLMIRQWIEGSVPRDKAKLARLLRMSPQELEDYVGDWLDELMPEDEDGRRRNQRLAREREHAREKVEKRRRAGAKGAEVANSGGTEGGTESANAAANGSANAAASGPPFAAANGGTRASDSESVPEGECEGEPTECRRQEPYWSRDSGWQGITDEQKAKWAEAYPACDIDRQLAAMDEWLRANPAKAHKKRWRRFITNWLSRQQERGGDAKSNRPRDSGPQFQKARADDSLTRRLYGDENYNIVRE